MYFVIYNTVLHYFMQKQSSVNHTAKKWRVTSATVKYCVYPHITKLFTILNFQENIYTEYI